MIYFDFATGFNLPPFWRNSPVRILEPAKAGEASQKYQGNLYQVPVELKWEDESEWQRLPFDPVVSVTGKNVIVRRTPLKAHPDRPRRGSVKELWTQDDYEINIAGVFIGEDGEYPESDLRKLRRYCEGRKTVEIRSPLLTIFNIERLAVESYALPFTKGIENQMYTIKGYSDDLFDMLSEL